MAVDVAPRVAGGWPIEMIPDEHKLFMRIHEQWFDKESGDLTPGCFKNLPDEDRDGMSAEWDRYSSPSVARARKGNPAKFGVIALPGEGIRKIESQSVEHDPLPEVRAHSLVRGRKGSKHPKIRLAFLRIAVVILKSTDHIT